MPTVPYTYLIGWSFYNKFYYGVRYAKGCSPDDLWVKYKTSSKEVKKLVILYGNPDIVSVRKTFTSIAKAQLWENTVLRRMKVVKSAKWINKTDNKAIDYTAAVEGSKKGADKIRGVKQSTTHVNKKTQSLINWHTQNLTLYGEKRPNFSDTASRSNNVRIQENNHPFLNKQLRSEWVKDKVSRGVQGPHTVESIEKCRRNATAQIAKGSHISKVSWTCPHCGKNGKGAVNKDRWHFNNCRSKH